MAVNGSWVLKLIKVVATVIVVVVAVGVAMLTVIIPKATGSTSLTVLTGSMSPAIPPGSIVLVKPTDPSTIEAGEVITYQAEPGKAAYVTHRVVEVIMEDGQRSFVTKGDANRGNDVEPVPAGAVRGRVVFDAPFVGKFADVVRTPLGLIALVALPCGIYIWSQAREVGADLRRRKSEGTATPKEREQFRPISVGDAEWRSLDRGLLMARVDTDRAGLSDLILLTAAFGGVVAQVGGSGAIVTLAAEVALLDQFATELERWPHRELARSNVISLDTTAPEASSEDGDTEEAELDAVSTFTPIDQRHGVSPSIGPTELTREKGARPVVTPAPIRYPRDLDLALELEMAVEDSRTADV